MPAKKSSTENPPAAPKKPRARKRPATETQPVATETLPVASESRHDAQELPPAPSSRPSPPWFTPVAIALTAAVLMGILLEITRPLDLVAAEQSLAAMADTNGGGAVSRADLASAERVARTCREGLRSLVRMWNQYVDELKASEASPKRYRAARRRFDAAQKQASLAVRRCEQA
jgi:hypothetical protein